MKVVRLALITAFTLIPALTSVSYGQIGGQDVTEEQHVQQHVHMHSAPEAPQRVPCGPGCHGLCMVHGYGSCPQVGPGFFPAMRQALTPADQPYFGLQPLIAPRGYGSGYGSGYGYGYGCEPGYPAPYPARFPRLRAFLCAEPRGMQSTRPVEPMKTYTTRGPRDFLHPNPPSIGY